MSTDVMKKVYNFIDAVQTVTPKSSFYNTKDQKVLGLKKIHEEIKEIDEDLYKLFLFYPGINDYNRLSIMGNILSKKELAGVNLPVVIEDKTRLLVHDSFLSLMRETSYPRVMRFFLELKNRKINNKRLKKTILKFVLGDPNLVNRSLKYRTKMREVLRHAYGLKTSSVLCNFLNLKRETSYVVKKALDKEVFQYSSLSKDILSDFFLFVFKVPVTSYTVEAYNDYKNAHIDLDKYASRLPFEVVQGIRNAHHKEYDLKKVFEKTKVTMTKTQKITLQRASEKKGVKISTDFSSYNPVQLYKYAYERGWSDKIREALEKRVAQSSSKFDLNLGKIALVIDNSLSMGGKKDAKNDPMARILSIAKFLEVSSHLCQRFYTSETENEELPTVGGDSSVGKQLVRAARQNPDTIFILSDGYENAPEGLTTLVVKGLRNAGVNIPIVHINPVFAAEASKAKRISSEVPTLPLFDLNQLEGMFMKALLERNPNKGVKFLKSFLFGNATKHFGLVLPENIKKELEEQRKIDFSYFISN